jgi:hypothetical protein
MRDDCVLMKKKMLRERGYRRDHRGFWHAPDAIGLKTEMLRDNENEDDE